MPYRYILLASVLATAGDLVFSGDPEGEFLCAGRAHRKQAVELSNRRGESRIGRFLFGRRAGSTSRPRPVGNRPSPGRSSLRLFPDQNWRARFHLDRVRVAGGFEMKRALLLLIIPRAGLVTELG